MKTRKNKIYLRTAAGALVASLFLSLSPGVVGVDRKAGKYIVQTPEYTEGGKILENESIGTAPEARTYAIERARINYNLPGIPSRNLSYYSAKTVRFNGTKLKTTAPVINGIVYVSLEDFSSSVADADFTYNKSTRTAAVKARGLLLTATDGGFVIYANDRPLFSFSPTILMSNGEVYVPASALEKALGIKRASNTSSEIRYTGTYKPLLSAKSYYREDEVYWLSKIISAESSGESLLGQIAVGDVILNRVKSPLFPNTIYSVIFDRKYGVQFSPTADGRIYAAPTYTATLAAKICLEGVSLSDDAMYFLNPRVAQSNWIVNNRPYVYTIGNHDFYR